MPPHCDSMDGPVVTAARRALDAGDVRLILPFVQEDGEDEVQAAFHRAMAARDGNAAVNEVADLYFFDTVVRVHRRGEGAAYTGLKPAGLPVGPVIPIAERAIEANRPDELVAFLGEALRDQIRRRFLALMEDKAHADEGVPAARRYVQASLGLEVWAHGLYGAIHAAGHGAESSTHEHVQAMGEHAGTAAAVGGHAT